ncbi:MAG: hypothetical protein CMJ59_21390 [Planctomycetaceae bacterium]|nr:hypothetical protein [Planctomycetaceae bacterium]
MIDPERHAENRGWIESKLRKIPGFRGYLEKEYRRESDYVVRAWMAELLQKSKVTLDTYSRTLVESLQIDDLPAIERARARLDQVMSKIRGDVRGYSAFFGFVNVDEQRLDAVYDQDMEMVGQVEELVAAIDQLTSSGTGPKEVASELLQRIGDLEQRYLRRHEILKGLADGTPTETEP